MATAEPDPRPSQQPPPRDEPPIPRHPAARWAFPLVLLASGVIWALIAHVLAHG